jgi:hypothetical protein
VSFFVSLACLLACLACPVGVSVTEGWVFRCGTLGLLLHPPFVDIGVTCPPPLIAGLGMSEQTEIAVGTWLFAERPTP